MHTALTIAGSDSCGGAGIQADLKTFTVLGVYGMSVVTAVTAQNTVGVEAAVMLDPAFVRRQLDAVARDLRVDACKTGMLGTSELVLAVSDGIEAHRLRPLVCDPVMFAKSGDRLLADDAVEAVKRRLLPLAAVATPNRREAGLLAGITGELTLETAPQAAERIFSLGVASVVIKGLADIVNGTPCVVDLLFDGEQMSRFESQRLPDRRNHGSGCAFSAAITACLAKGLDVRAAVAEARQLVTAGIRDAVPLGRGTSPVNVLAHAPVARLI